MVSFVISTILKIPPEKNVGDSLPHFPRFFNRKKCKRAAFVRYGRGRPEQNAEKRPSGDGRFRKSQSNDLALLLHLGEAVAAIDGTIGLGLEGNLRLAAAGSADSGEVLAGTTGGVLASVAAGLAGWGSFWKPRSA